MFSLVCGIVHQLNNGEVDDQLVESVFIKSSSSCRFEPFIQHTFCRNKNDESINYLCSALIGKSENFGKALAYEVMVCYFPTTNISR
jgi:hypothetical protein